MPTDGLIPVAVGIFCTHRQGEHLMERLCSFTDCGRRHMARGLCGGHLTQHYKGRPLSPLRSGTALERFNRRYVIGDDGCWHWQGQRGNTGYGKISDDQGKSTRPHRLAYELFVGPIPAGNVIDHKCRNRMCVNPDHLQAVTQKQNTENQSAEGHGSSGHRGVYWDKVNQKWEARVTHNDKLHWGGRHSTIEEAIAAAVALRNRLFTNNLADRASAT